MPAMIETELDGLTHRCYDPNCHVRAFIATIKLQREERLSREGK